MSNTILQTSKLENNVFFIISVLLIFPIPQIAIDVYLPSLPSMAVYFHTSSYYSLLTLNIYLLSLGVAQLIYGPCSDRFGRKPVLLIGISIFFVGSVACTFAGSIFQLIVFRVVQGLGMGCGLVVASAILGESFTGKKLAKMTTWSSTIFSLSVLLAPLLGGYLQTWGGWRTNFVFITCSSILLFLTTICFIPETNIKKDVTAINIKKIVSNYSSVVSNLKFMSYVASSLFGYGLGVTFSIVGPFLLQNILHVSIIHTGIMLLLTGLAYLIGTLMNNKLLNLVSVNKAILIGIIIMLVSSVFLYASGVIGWFTPLSVMLFTCLAVFGVGFIFPNCYAKSLEIFPDKLGVASAIISSVNLVGVSLIGVLVSRLVIHNAIGLGIIYFIESICCLASYLLICLPSMQDTEVFTKTIL